MRQNEVNKYCHWLIRKFCATIDGYSSNQRRKKRSYISGVLISITMSGEKMKDATSEAVASAMLARRGSNLSPLPAHAHAEFQFAPSLRNHIQNWVSKTISRFQHLRNPLFSSPLHRHQLRHLQHDEDSNAKQWVFPAMVLEHTAVDLCVTITPFLAHFDENIRAAAAVSFTELAHVFDPEEDYFQKTRVIIEHLKEAHDVYEPIHAFFTKIGHSLRIMVYAYVVGLEGLYLHPETNVRDCAITVVSRMVVDEHLADSENEQSNLTIVCNLIFLLDDVDHSLHGHRLAAISALGLLAEFYAHLEAITSHVVTRMLTLVDKSSTERKEILSVLKSIFTLVARTENKYNLLAAYGGLLTATSEENYDLLVESLETYLQLVSPKLEHPTVQQYVLCVQEHLGTAQPMVRYGAACSLYNLLKAMGNKLLRAEPNFISQTITGCMDSNCAIMAVNLEILAEISRLTGYKHLNTTIDHFLAACTDRSTPETGEQKPPTTLLSVLQLAVKATNATVEPGILINMANSNSLRLLRPKERLNQLRLVSLWAVTVETIDPVFLQQLLGMLHSPEDEVVLCVLDIFAVLSPAMEKVDEYTAEYIYLYVMKALRINSEKRRDIFNKILDSLVTFPFHKLSAETLDKLPFEIIQLGGMQTVSARVSIYTFLSSAVHFWKTVDLNMKVLALLLLTIGDESSTAAAEACRSTIALCQHLLDLGEDGFEAQPAVEVMVEELNNQQGRFASEDIYERVNAYDKVASVLGQPGIMGMSELAGSLLSETTLKTAKSWFENEEDGASTPYFPHWAILLFGRNTMGSFSPARSVGY